MRNRSDIETALRNELNQWFPKQCKNIYNDYYLYYSETTKDKPGNLLINTELPSNNGYFLAVGEKINKGATIEDNFNHLRRFIGILPILEI